MAYVKRVVTTEYYLNGRKVSSSVPGAKKKVRTSDCYYAFFRDRQGRPKRVRLKDVTYREDAERLLRQLERQEQRPLPKISKEPLLSLVQNYGEYRAGKEITQDHIRQENARVLQVLVRWLGYKELSEVDPVQVQAYIERGILKPKTRRAKPVPLSARSKNLLMGSLKRFGAWLKENRYWKRNLFTRLKKVRGPERKVRRFLSPEELQRLLANTGKRERNNPDLLIAEERKLCYKFLYYTLCRYGSVRKLRVHQLMLDSDPAEVLFSSSDVKGRRSIRKVLHPVLAEDLKAWIAKTRKKPKDLLFDLPAKITHVFDKDLKAAGIPKRLADGTTVDIHCIKTTGITMLANSQVPVKVIQEMAEHKSVVTTLKHYARVTRQSLVQAVQALPVIQDGPSGSDAR